jgi:hypothetical protein
MPNQEATKSGSSEVAISPSQGLLIFLTHGLWDTRCSYVPESATSEVGEFETRGLPASWTHEHREIGSSDLPIFLVGNFPCRAAEACASPGPVCEGHSCGPLAEGKTGRNRRTIGTKKATLARRFSLPA